MKSGPTIAQMSLFVGALGVLLVAAWYAVRREPRDAPAPSVPPSGRVKRVVLLRGPAGERTVTVELPAVIGRAPDADIRIDDAGVAPHHASLGIGAGEAVVLTSLDGVIGHDVAGAPRERILLEPGTEVVIGATTLWLVERRAVPSHPGA